MLKQRLHRSGVPAIYANDNFGRWESDFTAIVQACRSRGGPSRKLVELIAPAAEDRSVLKPRHSAFFGTPLAFLLDDLGARRLVITGIATDSCVMLTASDAFVRGYRIWVPADCVAAETPQFSRAALAHMARVSKASIAPSSTPLNVAFKASAGP